MLIKTSTKFRSWYYRNKSSRLLYALLNFIMLYYVNLGLPYRVKRIEYLDSYTEMFY